MNGYAKESDVIKLGWLPIIERFEFKTTKLTFKALRCPEWPDYLPLKFHKSNRRVTLRNNDDHKLPYVKACVRYFHQIFIFSPNDSPSKTMKNAFYFI